MTVAVTTTAGQRRMQQGDLMIALPPADLSLAQDVEWCVVRVDGEWR